MTTNNTYLNADGSLNWEAFERQCMRVLEETVAAAVERSRIAGRKVIRTGPPEHEKIYVLTYGDGASEVLGANNSAGMFVSFYDQMRGGVSIDNDALSLVKRVSPPTADSEGGRE